MAQQVFVCKDIEMKDGDVRIIRQDKVEVGVYRHEGAFYAYRNHCLHQGGPACEGIIRGKVVDLYGPDKSHLGQTYDDDEPHIICPWHGWEYKLKTSECAPDPKLRLRSYEVVQKEGGIYVATCRSGSPRRDAGARRRDARGGPRRTRPHPGCRASHPDCQCGQDLRRQG